MKRQQMRSLLGSLFTTLSVSGSAHAALAFQTSMRVARHANVSSISNSTYDAKFADANDALITDSGSDDVSCDLAIYRFDTWWFSGGGSTDIVSTDQELIDTLFNVVDAPINVVNQVNRCGGQTGTFGGCGTQDAALVARNAFVGSSGGLVLAHEFGHTVGLLHDDSVPLLLMHSTMGGPKVKNSTQCSTFRTAYGPTCKSGSAGTDQCICSPWVSGFSAVASPNRTRVSLAQRAMLQPAYQTVFSGIPVRQAALSTIVDRIPVEVDGFYDQGDVAILMDMLADSANSEYARTIVTLVALISDGSDAHVLSIADSCPDPLHVT